MYTKKKKLTMGIMAAFVSAAITGCDRADVVSVTSVDQCMSEGMDLMYCQDQWDKAKSMHEDVAPKFDTASSCVSEFGQACESRRVTNADGSSSNVWLPMMAGMMVGNMLSSKGTHVANTQPLYMSGAQKTDRGTYVGSLVTPSGNSVNVGKSSVSPSTASKPTKATVASTKSSISSRGGFGSSARGGSGAS